MPSKDIALIFFPAFPLFWTYLFDLQNTVKKNAPPPKIKNKKEGQLEFIYSKNSKHKELIFLNAPAGAVREAGKPGENCVLLKWQVPASDWYSLQSFPQLHSFSLAPMIYGISLY